MLLDYLKADIAEMIELAQKIENYDATLAASHAMSTPITRLTLRTWSVAAAASGLFNCGISGRLSPRKAVRVKSAVHIEGRGPGHQSCAVTSGHVFTDQANNVARGTHQAPKPSLQRETVLLFNWVIVLMVMIGAGFGFVKGFVPSLLE